MGSQEPNEGPMDDQDDSGCVEDGPSEPPYTGQAHILDLSDDVLLCILRLCSPRDLKALGHTCRRLGLLICDHTLWQRVDARASPIGLERMRWLLNHCLSPATQELQVTGYVDRHVRCLGIQEQTFPLNGGLETAPTGIPSDLNVEHFLLRMWYPNLPRSYAMSPRWPDRSTQRLPEEQRSNNNNNNSNNVENNANNNVTNNNARDALSPISKFAKVIEDGAKSGASTSKGANSGDSGQSEEISLSDAPSTSGASNQISSETDENSGGPSKKPKLERSSDTSGNSSDLNRNSSDPVIKSSDSDDNSSDDKRSVWTFRRNSQPFQSQVTVPVERVPVKQRCQGPTFTLNSGLLKILRNKCQNLTSLSLEYCNLDYKNTNLRHFPPKLKKLSLKGSRCYNLPLSTSYLGKIQDRLPELEDLDISECDWFDPASLMPLSKVPKLRRLLMQNCRRLTECVAYASLATRYGFQELRHLDMRGSPVADSEVSAFGWLPVLEELYVSPPGGRTAVEHAHKWDEVFTPVNELEPWEADEPEYYRCNSPPAIDEEDDPTIDEPNVQEHQVMLGNYINCASLERRIIVIHPTRQNEPQQAGRQANPAPQAGQLGVQHAAQQNAQQVGPQAGQQGVLQAAAHAGQQAALQGGQQAARQPMQQAAPQVILQAAPQAAQQPAPQAVQQVAQQDAQHPVQQAAPQAMQQAALRYLRQAVRQPIQLVAQQPNHQIFLLPLEQDAQHADQHAVQQQDQQEVQQDEQQAPRQDEQQAPHQDAQQQNEQEPEGQEVQQDVQQVPQQDEQRDMEQDGQQEEQQNEQEPIQQDDQEMEEDGQEDDTQDDTQDEQQDGQQDGQQDEQQDGQQGDTQDEHQIEQEPAQQAAEEDQQPAQQDAQQDEQQVVQEVGEQAPQQDAQQAAPQAAHRGLISDGLCEDIAAEITAHISSRILNRNINAAQVVAALQAVRQAIAEDAQQDIAEHEQADQQEAQQADVQVAPQAAEQVEQQAGEQVAPQAAEQVTQQAGEQVAPEAAEQVAQQSGEQDAPPAAEQVAAQDAHQASAHAGAKRPNEDDALDLVKRPRLDQGPSNQEQQPIGQENVNQNQAQPINMSQNNARTSRQNSAGRNAQAARQNAQAARPNAQAARQNAHAGRQNAQAARQNAPVAHIVQAPNAHANNLQQQYGQPNYGRNYAAGGQYNQGVPANNGRQFAGNRQAPQAENGQRVQIINDQGVVYIRAGHGQRARLARYLPYEREQREERNLFEDYRHGVPLQARVDEHGNGYIEFAPPDPPEELPPIQGRGVVFVRGGAQAVIYDQADNFINVNQAQFNQAPQNLRGLAGQGVMANGVQFVRDRGRHQGYQENGRGYQGAQGHNQGRGYAAQGGLRQGHNNQGVNGRAGGHGRHHRARARPAPEGLGVQADMPNVGVAHVDVAIQADPIQPAEADIQAARDPQAAENVAPLPELNLGDMEDEFGPAAFDNNDMAEENGAFLRLGDREPQEVRGGRQGRQEGVEPNRRFVPGLLGGAVGAMRGRARQNNQGQNHRPPNQNNQGQNHRPPNQNNQGQNHRPPDQNNQGQNNRPHNQPNRRPDLFMAPEEFAAHMRPLIQMAENGRFDHLPNRDIRGELLEVVRNVAERARPHLQRQAAERNQPQPERNAPRPNDQANANANRRGHQYMHIDVDIQRQNLPRVPANIAPQLVSDSAILRFGRADNDNINYVHIGHVHGNEPGMRPDRSNLRVLSVRGYRSITDRSLEHLATAAPHLRLVDFSGTSVTARGVEMFKAIRPNCEVIFGPITDNDQGNAN